jgi:tetratricopeptide (TPR) repeat protein
VVAARQGSALARQVGSPPYAAWNQRALGQALAALGEPEKGLAHLQAAAHTFETHAWPAMLAGSLLRLGLVLASAGAPGQATEPLERVRTLSQETHEPYEAAYALAVLARLRLARGDIEAGRQLAEEAAALVCGIGLPWHRAGTLAQLAAVWFALNQTALALTAAEEALCIAKAEDLREIRAQARALRKQVLALQKIS